MLHWPRRGAATSGDPQRRRRLEAQHPTRDDRPRAVADVQRAVLAERQDVVQARGRAGAQAPGGGLGEPAHDEPRERRRQVRQVRERDAVAAGQRGVDDDVEHLGLLAQQLGGAHDVGRRARVDRLQRGQQAVAHAPAREVLGGVGGVVAPGQAARATPGAGLLARDRQQRAHEVARARPHAEQRAAPGRGGQPVEHGLGLVGGGVADRHEIAARRPRSPRA